MAIIGYIAIQTEFLGGVIPTRYLQIVFMAAFGAAPILLMLKAISRLFLTGFKGQSLPFIEQMFSIYYVFLTIEARAEWRSYIEEQKNKRN
jgi:hypothetical protein